MAAKRQRFWEIHSCGHPVPYDVLLNGLSDSEAVKKARAARQAAERKEKAKGKCPACLGVDVHWNWDIRPANPRVGLPVLAFELPKDATPERIKQAKKETQAVRAMRNTRLKKADLHLQEWRDLLEAPWRPERLELHIQAFQQALIAVQRLEQIAAPEWWMDRAELDTVHLLAEAMAEGRLADIDDTDQLDIPAFALRQVAA